MRRTAIVSISIWAAGLAAGCNGSSGSTCDPSPGTLGGTCVIGAAGQCVDFGGLGTSDAESVDVGCGMLGGTWRETPACPTPARIGTCTIPATGPNTNVNCSPTATIQIRYYPPNYDLTKAQNVCAGVAGATFVPG